MFQFNPYAIFMAVAGGISFLLLRTIWQRRPGVGITAYTNMLSGVIVWALANAVKLTLVSEMGQWICIVIAYIGIVTVPASWLAFTLDYTGKRKWLTRSTIALLLVEPILVMAFILTNGQHSLFFTGLEITTSPYFIADTIFGPAFWVHAVYSYLLILGGTIALIAAIIRSPQLYRGQVFWLILGALAPWVANAITIFELLPLAKMLDLTPIAFTITGAATAWSMSRYRLMDIMPVAKEVVIRTMPDALIVLDGRSRVVEANPEALRIMEAKSQDVLFKPVTEVFSMHKQLSEEIAKGGEAVKEVTLTGSDDPVTYAMRVSLIEGRGGEKPGRVVLLHDISDLKRANREMAEARKLAEAANQMKSQFLANMSHELRTPLNAIIGYAQLQLAGMVGDISDEIAEYQERILVNAQDLLRLINDVLDVSKIEAGRMELVKRPYDSAEMMREIGKQFQVLAEKKNLDFKLDLDEALPEKLIGDESRTKQITINLISNAIKFTQEGEVILRTKKADDHHWQIIVTDTGLGIPAQMREVIFDEFRQVDAGSTREYGGTGLGLAIVRRLVLMMEGTIQVKSEVGQGSTFTVTLPLIAESKPVLVEA